MKSNKLLLIIGIMAFCSVFSAAAQVTGANSQTVDSITPEFKTGVFQVILEGNAGEGGYFYKLDFNSDKTVRIEKQFNGKNYKETMKWTQDKSKIQLLGTTENKLPEMALAVLTIKNEKTIQVEMPEHKFSLTRWNAPISYAQLFLTLIILILLNELFRKYKWSGYIFFFALPFLLIPVWFSSEIGYWFKWAKLYSVIFASCWFLLMRHTKLEKYNFAKMVCVIFLAGNIGEAVTQDFTMGFLPNILNGIAGILSIITCFYGWKAIKSDSSKEKDMIWPGMTVLWIIAYDVWNFVYVYLNFPGSASTQFIVLTAATLPALFIKRGTWLQARGFTLAAWFMYYFTFADFYEAHVVTLPRNDAIQLSFGILSIVLNIACGVMFIVMISKNRKKKVIA